VIDLLRRHPGSSVALIDGGTGAEVTYAELLSAVDTCAESFAQRPLVFLAPEASKDAVVAYLACLAAKTPVALVEPEMLPLFKLNGVYQPDLLVVPAALQPPPGVSRRVGLPGASSLAVYERDADVPGEIHESLQLLLSTSGSTGSPKTVRLTAANLSANATSIAQYLGVTPGERAMQSLPLQYSYGLSVLNSHLAAGASIVLCRHSFLQPEFWRTLDERRCTSFAGVPFMYQTLFKLKWDVKRHRTLRTLTQAGGPLRPELISHFHRAAL
jgi:acyl-CoA synthetase (AMP-forming)/AMP-acid ligase II